MTAATRIDWPTILARGAAIVRSYTTGVTLRQLFYRLVAALLFPNTHNAYSGLSRQTARARRADAFPALIDLGRGIERPLRFDNPGAALDALVDQYRLDRTLGQPYAIYLGVEKHGITAQLSAWFGDALGLPILALGGYSSQTFVDDVARSLQSDWEQHERPSVLIYAGDFDASGEDIPRDFVERVAQRWGFDEVRRIALNAEQIAEYGLPPQPGKATDSRAAGFIARHGELVQVELDALDPDDLRDLYQRALDDYWDATAYGAVMLREAPQREQLAGLRPHLNGAA